MITTLLLTLALFQQPTQIDCAVTGIADGKAVVICDSRNPVPACKSNMDPECVKVILDYPLDQWPSAWPKAERGTVVRARWTDGHLRPVACRSEQMRGLYDRPPLNAVTDDAVDCNRQPSEFIRELLERVLRN